MPRAFRFPRRRLLSSSSTGASAVNTTRDHVDAVGTLPFLRKLHHVEISKLPEIKAREKLRSFLECISKDGFNNRKKIKEEYYRYGFGSFTTSTDPHCNHYQQHNKSNILSPEKVRIILDASIASFHLHVESRVAALCGKGFYTIGPCGEEVLSAAACALQPQDTVALHYRHLGISIARSLLQPAGTSISSSSSSSSLEQIILDRARAYVVSKYDPVTGGVHCAIGGGTLKKNDYVATSTLASQCPPAVGRALGFSLVNKLLLSTDEEKRSNNLRPISFVSIGDGSIHNAHFLSSLNLALHARFRRICCPIVFAISDNGLSISYKTDGYGLALLETLSTSGPVGLPVFKANGSNAWEIYDKTLQAVEYARRRSAPAIVYYTDITRRFGHAATDRQLAYRSIDEIQLDQERDVISGLIVNYINEGIMTCDEVLQQYDNIQQLVVTAFNMASEEPKHNSRAEMVERVSAPYINVPRLSDLTVDIRSIGNYGLVGNAGSTKGEKDDNKFPAESATTAATSFEKTDIMRKHMTRVIGESLDRHLEIVYIGEDVEHGGYYLVTDGLADRFPSRVLDFPPDETTLIGAAMGFSQLGLCPIVEIPYSKYLDCGADMFFEAALSYWLTSGQQPNGMVVRLQGFDRGTFGGNFHTHNMLHMPPGVDVLCYSNGLDYVRGFRNAIIQAKAGRIVMLVDSTNLLNLRHLFGKDRAWERQYPVDVNQIMGYHDVVRYCSTTALTCTVVRKIAVVTYGNGVIASIHGREEWLSCKERSMAYAVDVIDCPLLSEVPEGLKELLLSRYDHVIFADVCKEGPSPLTSMIVKLQAESLLPTSWACLQAPRTYNPLGSTITFLGIDDIIDALNALT